MAIFEFTPIVLALVSIYFCTIKFSGTNRRIERIILCMGVLASVIMIVAQMSWFTTVVVQHNLIGSWFANKLWTIFNSLVMVILITFAYSRVR